MPHEAVQFDGKNDGEILNLVARVCEMGAWSAVLQDDTLTVEVRTAEPHLGANVTRNSDGAVVVRVEEGNWLIFDPFAVTPLFVLTPDHYEVFYGGGS